ncbi:unnamed protein product [Cochlearia groenlandica]
MTRSKDDIDGEIIIYGDENHMDGGDQREEIILMMKSKWHKDWSNGKIIEATNFCIYEDKIVLLTIKEV